MFYMGVHRQKWRPEGPHSSSDGYFFFSLLLGPPEVADGPSSLVVELHHHQMISSGQRFRRAVHAWRLIEPLVQQWCPVDEDAHSVRGHVGEHVGAGSEGEVSLPADGEVGHRRGAAGEGVGPIELQLRVSRGLSG